MYDECVHCDDCEYCEFCNVDGKCLYGYVKKQVNENEDAGNDL